MAIAATITIGLTARLLDQSDGEMPRFERGKIGVPTIPEPTVTTDTIGSTLGSNQKVNEEVGGI